MKNNLRQKGFTVVEGLLIVAVVAIVGVVGWFAYQHNRPQTSNAVKDSGQPDATTPPASSTMFTSVAGGFSFTYPEGWEVIEQTPTANESGHYIYLNPPSNAASSNVNKFLVTLIVADNPDVRLGEIADGTTQMLPNGLRLWVTDSDHASRTIDGNTVACPELAIVSGDGAHFSNPVPNGKNLALVAGYCAGERLTTTLSYQAQVNSADWRKLVDIIGSITFN